MVLRHLRKLVLGLTIGGAALVLLTGVGSSALTAGAAGYLGTVAPGAAVTATGSGFKANSTITLTFESTPVPLGTVVADSAGNFSASVTIPANATNGDHNIVASGVDPSGNPYSQSTLLLVQAPVVTTSAPGLAFTGTNAELLVGFAALAILLGGPIVRTASRRNRTAP